MGGAVTGRHGDDQPTPAYYVRRPVLQHHGHRERKYLTILQQWVAFYHIIIRYCHNIIGQRIILYRE